ncbi:global DNA-binding transcriptional dual regulator Fis [compost metagenome]
MSDNADGDDTKPSLKTVANEAEYDMIMQVLRDVNFNKSKAARLLNIDRKTLYNKMKQFDI